MKGSNGKIIRIIGPVIDAEFEREQLPPIFNALEIKTGSGTVIAEVMQQLGDSVIRCVALNSTEGLKRGMNIGDMGGPIKVPVGKE
ncbi:MAG TPA: F0F1 ATP synthase subunit beta, partial [Clostridiales bacterium]|nr:F0F1 ATP synthase subunit beta [Clostridiales bacterium]